MMACLVLSGLSLQQSPCARRRRPGVRMYGKHAVRAQGEAGPKGSEGVVQKIGKIWDVRKVEGGGCWTAYRV